MHFISTPEEERAKSMGEKDKKSTEEREKKGEETKNEEKSEEPKADQQPPAKEIILKVYMHCEGCARKVHRCLKGFEGVEEVITDCRTIKVVVKGEKADPLKVLQRVHKKSHSQVELLSPLPMPLAPEPNNKPEEIDIHEAAAAPVVTVLLGISMHCEACAQEIKRRIQRMKEADLKTSQVTVKGVFEAEKLVDYVQKRTGNQFIIVVKLVEPETETIIKKEQEENVVVLEENHQKDESRAEELPVKLVQADDQEGIE